jgi:uncharacterized protein (DUF3820 family)
MTSLSYSHRGGFFNREIWTRTLIGGDAETPVFTDVEVKLLRLGLDRAAHPGEVDACAVQLFRSLRRRGLTAEDLLRRSAQAIWAARELAAARGRVITFGKYRGKTIGEIPMSYLRWALKSCRDMSHNLRRSMQIVLNYETSSKA